MRTNCWRIIHFFTALLVSANSPVLAQVSPKALPDNLEDLFFQKVPQVISATRMQQSRLESPVAVTIINRQMINASGFTEIIDLLRLAPGFQVAHVDGRRFAPAYHGTARDAQARLQVLINGRSVYHAILSAVNWNALGVHIDNIERIEIIRGPNAPAFGSNAFLGTVNIITRAPFLNDGLQASMNIGNLNFKEVTARLGSQVGPLDLNITANFLQHDGFDEQDDWRELGMINIQTVIQISPNDKISGYFGKRQGTTGADGVEGKAVFPLRDRKTNVEYQQFKWAKNFSRSDLNVQLYHNKSQENDEYEMLETLSTIAGISPEELFSLFNLNDQKLISGYYYGKTDRYDAEIENVWNFQNGHDLVAGMGYRIDEISSKYYFSHSKTLREKSYRAFSNSAIKLSKKFKLNLGVIAEDSNLSKTHYSPRVGLNWFATPNHVLRISTTKAQRSPSLLERNFNFSNKLDDGTIIDVLARTEEELLSEKITSKEIGYIGKFTNKKLYIEIKAFEENISDVLSWPRKNGYSDFANDGALSIRSGGEVSTRGIEGQISWKPNLLDFLTLQYANSQGRGERISNVNPLKYEDLSNAIPRHTFNLLGSKSLGNQWQFSLGYYYYSSMRWLGEGDLIKSYNRIDFNLRKNWNFFDKNLSVIFGVQNFNNEIHQFNTHALFKPRYYLRMEYRNH